MHYRCANRAWCVLIAVAMMAWLGVVPSPTLAQSADPSFLPRLAFGDIAYAGAFRVPADSSNGENFQGGGQALAFNPGNASLFITSHAGLVAEISVPTPAQSSNPADLPVAKFLQGFADPVEGKIKQVGNTGTWTNSLVVHDGKLFGTASIYYDALNQQNISHFHRGLQLHSSNFHGFTQVWEKGKTGFVAGNLALVPAEWQKLLGGEMVSGQCCVPIISRTSWGPAAFAFDPKDIGKAVAPASPLVYYSQQHPTLGKWESTNETYGQGTEMGGLVIVAGTRTALFFGRNGLGPACYGSGTGDLSLVGKIASDGSVYCYDPTSPYKGTHAYPYRYQIWAYDLNDFAAVKAGKKDPWAVTPYDVWPFEFPTPEPKVLIGGVSYDPEHQTIYISQSAADVESRPIVHVLKVGGGHEIAKPEPTTGHSAVTAVTMTSNKTAPQAPGSTIAFSAAAVGGNSANQYKWLVFDGASWSVASNWRTSNNFSWTPATPGPQYQVRVWVRGGDSTADKAEAQATMAFPVEQLAAVTVSGTSSPQVLGTTLSFSAAATGGMAPYQFKWRTFDGSSWTVRADWGPSSTLSWTPSSARSDYRIEVSVRSAGKTSDVAEGSASVPFVINAVPVAKVGSVSLSSDVASPQPLGTTVRFTATAAGGAGPLQYKWSTFDGASWSAVGGWVSAATFNWKTGAAGAYQIAVAVRSAGSTAEQGEASATMSYTMSAAPAASTPQAGPYKMVEISPSKASPQAPNTAITWTATASGSSAPAVYKWLVFEGGKWVTAVNWSPSAQFSWVPKSAGNHLIGVWVKRADNHNDAAEASYTTAYVIK